jgi:transposase
MGRHVLKVQGYTPDQIKEFFRKDERYTLGIRLYAVYQVSLGKSSRSLEELYNTSFKQITNWVHQFEEGGIEGLRDKPGRGRRPKLSPEGLNNLKHLLLNESPEGHGFNTSTWTGPMVIEYIKREFGLSYKKAQVYNIMKRLGFTYQKGKGEYPESDIKARADFLCELKKTE